MISKKIEQEANAIETLPDGNLNTASVIIRGIWNLIIKISDSKVPSKMHLLLSHLKNLKSLLRIRVRI